MADRAPETLRAALRAEGLEKVYDGVTALRGVSFQVAPGEVVGLLGPNGAGKTTTLRLLAGMFPPTAGRVEVAGRDLAREPLAAKRRLILIPDDPQFFEQLTVREHLEFFGRLYGISDAPARIQALLAEVELTEKEEVFPEALSRGMRQKLALACALLVRPEALLLDEPFTGLDPMAIRWLRGLLRREARRGAGVLVSSHLLSLVATVCDRFLVLHRGQVIAAGDLETLRAGLPDLRGDADLEEVFFRVVAEDSAP